MKTVLMILFMVIASYSQSDTVMNKIVTDGNIYVGYGYISSVDAWNKSVYDYCLFSSTDCHTWVKNLRYKYHALNPISSICDIIWAGNKFVAVGYAAGPISVVYFSFDGVFWLEQNPPPIDAGNYETVSLALHDIRWSNTDYYYLARVYLYKIYTLKSGYYYLKGTPIDSTITWTADSGKGWDNMQSPNYVTVPNMVENVSISRPVTLQTNKAPYDVLGRKVSGQLNTGIYITKGKRFVIYK